jgi:hypothetical protein
MPGMMPEFGFWNGNRPVAVEAENGLESDNAFANSFRNSWLDSRFRRVCCSRQWRHLSENTSADSADRGQGSRRSTRLEPPLSRNRFRAWLPRGRADKPLSLGDRQSWCFPRHRIHAGKIKVTAAAPATGNSPPKADIVVSSYFANVSHDLED